MDKIWSEEVGESSDINSDAAAASRLQRQLTVDSILIPRQQLMKKHFTD